MGDLTKHRLNQHLTPSKCGHIQRYRDYVRAGYRVEKLVAKDQSASSEHSILPSYPSLAANHDCRDNMSCSGFFHFFEILGVLNRDIV